MGELLSGVNETAGGWGALRRRDKYRFSVSYNAGGRGIKE
jgi:hypothetical protein